LGVINSLLLQQLCSRVFFPLTVHQGTCLTSAVAAGKLAAACYWWGRPRPLSWAENTDCGPVVPRVIRTVPPHNYRKS